MAMTIDAFNNTEQWAIEQWGQADLGDRRRNARAVRVGAAMAAQPSASLPTQTGSWNELKAAYRLLNEEEVTHRALSAAHWRRIRGQAASTNQPIVLFIQDTSELDFTTHRQTRGLGHIGNTKGRGFLMHSCLAVIPSAAHPEVIGVAAQHVWTRQHAPRKKQESRAARNKRDKESDVWAEIVEEIGPAPAAQTGTKWVSVGDAASDIFSYLRRTVALGWHALIRVSQDRVIQTPGGERARLLGYTRQLSTQAQKSLVLRGRNGLAHRNVNLQVAWSEVTLCSPCLGPERKQEPIKGWCIRCWEEAADGEEEPIEWILFTTIPVTNLRAALEVVEWYAQRWVIEDYHKCLKTGCAMEKRQLETADGLLAVLGFLAIVAVRLLQLRTLSRERPEALAQQEVPALLIDVLVVRLKLVAQTADITVREFWLGVARLGGFIGRKSDGDPGWQTLWRGWQRLQDLCWGAALIDATG